MNITSDDSPQSETGQEQKPQRDRRFIHDAEQSAPDHAWQRLQEQIPLSAPLAAISSTVPFPTSHFLAALNTLGHSVTTAPDTDQLFDKLLTVYPQLVPADRLLIYLWEDEALQLVACNLERDACIHLEQQLSAVIDEVMDTHRPARLSGTDIVSNSRAEESSTVGYAPLSLLLAPLVVQQKCAGIVVACAEAKDVFTDESLQALVAATHWLASAIRHEEQQAGLQRRLEELDTLATINRAISETVELQDVLQLIVESAGEIVCECDWAVLHLIDEASGQLHPVVTFGLTLQPHEYRLALDEGIIGNVFQSGTYINVHDLQADERRQPFDMVIQSRSMLVAPLKNNEECIGTLSVQCTTPGTYSEADEHLLSTLGLQAFVAIQNAELFHAQRSAYHQAEMLRDITADLGRSLDPEAVFLTLRRSLNKVFDYQYAVIMLLQENGQRASIHVCCDVAPSVKANPEQIEAFLHGCTLGEFESGEFALDSAPELQQLIEQRSVLVIEDVEADERWGDQFWFVPNLHSWIAAPMVAQDQVIGLFWIARQEAGGFGANDEQVLAESLARAAASALKNTSLYVEIQHASARLRRLNHMVLTAQEEERQRISRELHDESGQALSALIINLSMANQELQLGLPTTESGGSAYTELLAGVQQRLTGAIATVELTMDRIRELTHNLRPPMLSTLGLSATLEGLCQDFAAQTSITVRYTGAQLPPLPSIISISLYRILQEALANVAKHANAERVTISLGCSDNQIQLTVADDGRGFPTPASLNAPSSGIGLLGMMERCEMLNGSLQIDSQQNCGTTITATVPLGTVPVDA